MDYLEKEWIVLIAFKRTVDCMDCIYKEAWIVKISRKKMD